MPDVDSLSNKGSLNVLLDRTLSGLPAGLPPDRTMVGLFMNLARLTDKALREYDAARAELLLYVEPHDGLRTSPYLRAIDHMENCVSATHRGVLNATALRDNGIGHASPRLTQRQEERQAHLRNAIEHADEKLLGKQKFKKSPPFAKVEPYSLRLANTSMIIGQWVLTYSELASAMRKLHRTIEVIRGIPTGSPSVTFPNAKLRTDPGAPIKPTIGVGGLQWHPTDYLKELSRLVVNHS